MTDAKAPATAPEWNQMAKSLLTDLRSFAHEHRALTERQVTELRERYATPAVARAKDMSSQAQARAKDVRTQAEARVDAIARELEARYEKLETDLEKNLDKVLKRNGAKETAPATSSVEAAAAPTVETPGEMPTGESAHADKPKAKKPQAKKAE